LIDFTSLIYKSKGRRFFFWRAECRE